MIARAREMRDRARGMRAACREQKAQARNVLFALRLKRRVEERLAAKREEARS